MLICYTIDRREEMAEEKNFFFVLLFRYLTELYKIKN